MIGKLFIALAYASLVVYPYYLAGNAPGQPVELGRVSLYAAVVVLSCLTGAIIKDRWAWVLPWIPAAGLVWLEVVIRLPQLGRARSQGLFQSSDFVSTIGLLAVTSFGAWVLGERVAHRARARDRQSKD